MGLFKAAGDSLNRRKFLNDLNGRFKTGYVVNNDDYLVSFKTSISSEGLYLRGVVQNDYSITENKISLMGQSLLSNEMIKRELFALGFVGLQIIGKNNRIGLKWKLSDIDSSLTNNHPYLSMFGAVGESIGQIIDEKKSQKDFNDYMRTYAADIRERETQERRKKLAEKFYREEQEKEKEKADEEARKKEENIKNGLIYNCVKCSKLVTKFTVKCRYCGAIQI